MTVQSCRPVKVACSRPFLGRLVFVCLFLFVGLPLRFVRRLWVLHHVSSSLEGPVDPSFRALSGSLKFTVRRHTFDKDSLSFVVVFCFDWFHCLCVFLF